MNVRGLLPSLGAGGSLIAAAVCALAVFGGVLAFKGESPGTAEANAGDLVVPGRDVRAQTSSPGLVSTVLTVAQTGRATAAAPARRPRARTRLAATLPRRRATTRTTPGRATPPRATPPPAPKPSSPASSTPGGKPPSAPPAPKPPDLVPQGTAEHVVEQTRSAVQPVVDAVPPPVRAPVEQVADTVQDVASTVDDTVDGVTGTVLP